MFDAAFDSALAAERARRDADKMRQSPAAFRRNLQVDIGGGRIVPLGHVLETWQAADFKALDPGWETMVSAVSNPSALLRGYLERPRGHSKTTDIAAMASWALWAVPRKLVGVVAAGSEDQAALLRGAIDGMLRHNPWLGKTIRAQKGEVINVQTGSTLSILASDEHTTFGHTPDFVVLDEITHWKKQGLWTSLFSSIAKRPQCMLVIISNAGFGKGTSWQWEKREMARTSPEWYFHSLDGAQASWLTEKLLAEQRAGLPPKDYARLWGNRWQSGTGDALNMDLVYKSVVLPGPVFDQRYVGAVAGLDLGVNHDHCGFVVMGLDVERNKLVLQHTKRWAPSDYTNNRIPLGEVRTHVKDTCKRLNVLGVAYDPSQAELMADDIAASGTPCFAYPFSPSSCHEMARTMLEVFNNHRVEMYNDASLLTDLGRLVIEQRLIGYKLEAPRDERGHCDLATAFAIVLPWAIGTLNSYLADGDQAAA